MLLSLPSRGHNVCWWLHGSCCLGACAFNDMKIMFWVSTKTLSQSPFHSLVVLQPNCTSNHLDIAHRALNTAVHSAVSTSLLFSAILAIFGRLHFYYFVPRKMAKTAENS